MADLAAHKKRQAKEDALRGDVMAMRDMWISAGRKEYEFWSVMMAVYAGTFPGGCLGDPVAA